MRIVNRETAFEGEYLRLVRKTTVSKDDNIIVWETIERKNLYHGGAVVVVGLTNKGELILEKQWRAPTESYIIQFPGGLTDIKGESEEEAARREFTDETGYIARQLIPVVFVPAYPMSVSMRDRYYFAPDIEYKGTKNQDIAEEIEIILLPRENLYHYLTNLPDDTEMDLRVPGIVWILEQQGLL